AGEPLLRRLPDALRRRLPDAQRGARMVVADLRATVSSRPGTALLVLGAATGVFIAAAGLVGHAGTGGRGLPAGAGARVNGQLITADEYGRVVAAAADAPARARGREAAERWRHGEAFDAVRDAVGDAELAPLPDALLPPAKLLDYLGPTALRAALALAPGTVSDPVRSRTGYHVLQVVERRDDDDVPPAELRAELVAELRRRRGERALRARRPLAAAPGRLAYEWRLRCPAAGALAIRSTLLLDVAPGHLHFARVTRDGAGPAERVLTEREPSWLLDATAATPGSASVGTYVRLGVEHILGGADHLAFLVALLLLGGGLGGVARLVTGFTVGHSLTLGVAVLGWVHPDRPAVEALIGLSVAPVGVENGLLRGERTFVIP